MEEDAAEWAEHVAEYEAEAAAERGVDADPGPVPPVVEPETVGAVSTIAVSPLD